MAPRKFKRNRLPLPLPLPLPLHPPLHPPLPLPSHGQVDADDDGGLLEQALAMSMMDGDEVENMRVSAVRVPWWTKNKGGGGQSV